MDQSPIPEKQLHTHGCLMQQKQGLVINSSYACQFSDLNPFCAFPLQKGKLLTVSLLIWSMAITCPSQGCMTMPMVPLEPTIRCRHHQNQLLLSLLHLLQDLTPQVSKPSLQQCKNLYTLILVCIFSLPFSINFLWYCLGEFVYQSRFLVYDHFLYSRDLTV